MEEPDNDIEQAAVDEAELADAPSPAGEAQVDEPLAGETEDAQGEEPCADGAETDAPDAQVPPGLAEAEAGEDEEPAAVSDEVVATVEAVLFSTDSPLSPAKVAQVAELPNRRVVKKAIALLNERYERMGCVFRIESIAGGYQMMSMPEYHDVVSRLFRARSDSRLSQAAMETLAVVAYRQPVLRADIEAIRGVAAGEVLRGLMEKQLVKIVGRAEVIGRPMLYGTTKRFLEVFGLSDLSDLPKVEELRGGAKGMKDDKSGQASKDPQPAAAGEAPAEAAPPPPEPTAEPRAVEAIPPAAVEAPSPAGDEPPGP